MISGRKISEISVKAKPAFSSATDGFALLLTESFPVKYNLLNI